MIYCTEMISHVERLLYEAYTGDPKGYDIAYWRHMGVVDAIAHRGFPAAKDTFVNFRQGSINIADWPRNRDNQLIFLQQTAVTHHYKTHVWHLQRMKMSEFILRRFPRNTETGVLGEIKRVITEIMLVEWAEYIARFVSAKAVTNENAQKAAGDAPADIARYVERYKELRTAWDESAHHLSAEYYIHSLFKLTMIVAGLFH